MHLGEHLGYSFPRQLESLGEVITSIRTEVMRIITACAEANCTGNALRGSDGSWGSERAQGLARCQWEEVGLEPRSVWLWLTLQSKVGNLSHPLVPPSEREEWRKTWAIQGVGWLGAGEAASIPLTNWRGEGRVCRCVFTPKWSLHPRTFLYMRPVCVPQSGWMKKGMWRFVIPDPWWKSAWKSGLNFEDQFTHLRNNPGKGTLAFKEMSKTLPRESVILPAGCSGALCAAPTQWQLVCASSCELTVKCTGTSQAAWHPVGGREHVTLWTSVNAAARELVAKCLPAHCCLQATRALISTLSPPLGTLVGLMWKLGVPWV